MPELEDRAGPVHALFHRLLHGSSPRDVLGQDGLVLAHGPVEAEEAAAQAGGIVADTCGCAGGGGSNRGRMLAVLNDETPCFQEKHQVGTR